MTVARTGDYHITISVIHTEASHMTTPNSRSHQKEPVADRSPLGARLLLANMTEHQPNLNSPRHCDLVRCQAVVCSALLHACGCDRARLGYPTS